MLSRCRSLSTSFSGRPTLGFVILGLLLVLSSPVIAAQEETGPKGDPRLPDEVSDQVCLECHGPEKNPNLAREGRTSKLVVDGARFRKSVHRGMECATCHTHLPHQFGLPRVECRSCHESEAKEYAESIHGQRLAAGDELAPTCQECHGAHYVLSPSDPAAATAPFNIPGMCARCHAEGAPVERAHDIPQEQIFKRYTQSIHGEGLFRQGLVSTAVCTSCHTAHRVLPHTDARSTVSRENVVETCMQCHGLIESVHRKIIRGSLWEKEPHAVPVCVECHSPHEARKVLYDTQMSNSDCLLCHGREDVRASDGRSLFVSEQDYAGSVHGRRVVACTQCHTEVAIGAERPCATIESKVDCSICHEQAVSDYESGVHGKLHAKGDVDAPYCTDCHGTHDILEHAFRPQDPESLKKSVRSSPTFVFNLPRLCARCHSEGGEAYARYRGEEQEVVAHYTESIHGKGLMESGLTVTATCADCHTAHRELPRTDPGSSVHPDNVAATCGKCHDGIAESYMLSVHSPSANTSYERGEGMPPLPKCSDCHTSHTIGRTDVVGFELGIMDQCGKCHTDVSLTYFDTYHGKVSKLGETGVAKCHDCHGAHEIRSIDDPLSRLSESNIVGTCAKCHAGSHERFTGYLTHGTHHDRERYPALYYAFWGMTGLLVGTFSFFGLHTLLWLPRSWRMRKLARSTAAKVDPKAKQFVRFRRRHRAMHLAMVLSFFGLAITGMMLKFSSTAWAGALSWFFGGSEVAGFIHRFCAVVMFGVFFVHLRDVYVAYRKSGQTLVSFLIGPDSLVPNWTDVKEFFATIRWFVGRGPRPRYGRWTYWEKFDYFAVFWGIGIIGSTGLMLWFPEQATWVLPGWMINVATIIHSDEALLATGFIFTIHFFNTHFRPEKFPMDTVMFTGRMGMEEFKEERPREYEELVASGRLEEHLDDPASRIVTHGSKAFGFVAVTVGLILVALIIYAMMAHYL